jgi:hypothetical protein
LPIRTWRLLTSCIIFAHLFLSRNTTDFIAAELLLLPCCAFHAAAAYFHVIGRVREVERKPIKENKWNIY